MAESKVPPKIHCLGCGRMVENKEFFVNHNRWHKKYMYNRMCYCKSCQRDISREIVDGFSTGYNREDKFAYKLAFREICALFDMPYYEPAVEKVYDYEISVNEGRGGKAFNYVNQYGVALKACDVPESWWDNLSGNTLIATTMFRQTEKNDARLVQSGDMELLNGLVQDWDVQDSMEDYLFLEEKRDKYTKGEKLSASMQTVVKYLCLAELDVKKARNNKETKDKDLKILEDKVMGYFKTLGLDKFQFKDAKSAGENMLEQWIAKEEKSHPIEVFDSEFAEDMCKIREDNDDLMRAMKNLCTGSKDYPEFQEYD